MIRSIQNKIKVNYVIPIVFVRQTERRTRPTSEFHRMAKTEKMHSEMNRIWQTITERPTESLKAGVIQREKNNNNKPTLSNQVNFPVFLSQKAIDNLFFLNLTRVIIT